MKVNTRTVLGVVIGCMLLLPAVRWVTPVRAAGPSDARLQWAASRIVVKMDALAPRYTALPPVFDSNTDPYIKALRRIGRLYVKRHPHAGIDVAAALFVRPPGGMLLTTNTSDHLDWMAADFVYGPSTVTTPHQSFGGKTETYRIFNVSLVIPRPYRDDHFQSALAVYTVSR